MKSQRGSGCRADHYTADGQKDCQANFGLCIERLTEQHEK